VNVRMDPNTARLVGAHLAKLLELCDVLGVLNNGGVFNVQMIVSKEGPQITLHDFVTMEQVG
jgi:hypothetical protein